MKRLSLIRACWLLSIVGVLLAGAADAKKPSPPPPPPPIPGPEVYEWRPDLGGWLDTSNNLVWGYSMVALVGGTAPYSYAQGFAQNYPDVMNGTGDEFVVLAADAYGEGLTELGDEYAYWAEVSYDAAAFDDWRLPTLDEATNAIAKKLFTYGDGGFNSYRSEPGQPPGTAYGDIIRWSTTLSSNKKNGFTRRWVWQPLSGATGEAPEGWSLDAIVVRKHTP